ncbi:Phosphoserine aminotransferase [hydrothermal vent metagenome]|uniref:phosphoserine transaminase n=1 Tax=hydrothermal vent metagenome TaxID=652676 RepID=A0A3B0Y365_9ZZZZ
MSRVFNFSAGPAMVPTDVLLKAQQEMPDWNGTGTSVMEMSHRGKDYMSIAAQAEADVREILAIPDNYKVLFLQGGASAQFALLPMNFCAEGQSADYIVTGAWSKKAVAEAKRLCTVNIAGTSESSNFSDVPAIESLQLNPEAAYVHYTPNETIGGVEFPYIPETGEVPLIGDFSSTILSRPLEVSRFGVIYAGAQKNIGPAGLCLVIIREDLLARCSDSLPAVFNYKVLADNDSMYNTPPTYSWYLAGLVFEWIKQKGGLSVMGNTNQRKAEKLYKAIDDSSFYANPVVLAARSWMNIPFTLTNADFDATFLEQAAARGLVTLKGHRSVGGMRASIYNAMPEEGVDELIKFMAEFEATNS